MSVPKPPFHSASEELLYNIYLKIQDMDSLKESDINTLAKLNAILLDADLMKAEDIVSTINAIKGNVPVAGNTLEKLYTIIQGLGNLKSEDIDTLSEINAIITDADLLKIDDLVTAINSLKANAPLAGDTLEKLYNLIQPVLTGWIQNGNTTGSIQSIGTKDNFPLPFITANVERGRFDVNGNFLVGYGGLAIGKIHLRANNSLESNYALFVEDPDLNILFGLTNSGKFLLNKNRSNLLINGGWPQMSGQKNLILTSGALGAKMVDTGSDNIVVGYNAASSAGVDPSRGLARNVVIGSEAGSSDNNGTGYEDSVYIGYRAGRIIAGGAGLRNTMVGASSGATAAQSGSDNTSLGYDTQNARSNSFNTLLGSGTRAFNSLGDLVTNGGDQNYMTAIGAGAIVRTPNTLVIGRAAHDHVVIGAESSNFQLPGTSFNLGFNGYKLQVIKPGGLGLGVSGSSSFRDGNFSVSLGEEGSNVVKNSFRINSYVNGGGGYEFLLSANNLNAALEITDSQISGTKNEMIRLTPGGYANTAILVRPNDLQNAAYGYRYILQGTNINQQGRYISAFHALLNFPVDDVFPDTNHARLFAAEATVTNHYLDGFYADVRGTDPNAQVFAYRSIGSRILFDGNGMSFATPVVTITTDGSPHVGANNSFLNGNYILSAAQYIIPQGAERTGLIISPGHAQANGIFVSPQQALGTYNYDGYLMCLQYSTGGNNINAGTTKPMLYIRKHNVQRNGFDHSGAFIRMEENIGSSGTFIEAYQHDVGSNSLRLKFSVDKEGVVSIGQVTADPTNIENVGRLYIMNDELKFVAPSGEIKTLLTSFGP